MHTKCFITIRAQFVCWFLLGVAGVSGLVSRQHLDCWAWAWGERRENLHQPVQSTRRDLLRVKVHAYPNKWHGNVWDERINKWFGRGMMSICLYITCQYSICMCGSRFHHVQILQRNRPETLKEMKALKRSCFNVEELMQWNYSSCVMPGSWSS